ncbi:MAG: DUF1343 domain-containing protein [Bacteroidota bacterium]|nr:DUF1343 domain-containing protein [Bacteroidota bacterium]
MKKFLLLMFIPVLFFAQPKVKTGIEVLRDRGFDIIKGKRVGLVTNPTGVDSKLVSTVDILFNAKGVKLTALFGPEHGVRGDISAGDDVDNSKDRETGVPVFSLYGKTYKPTPEMLKNVDVLIYDIQDIGCRSYTYISTLGKVMEACAENNIPLIVLDRPNPLNGNRIEGNIVEDGFISFVSAFKIPYVYGLTCGELAKLVNEEGLLNNHKKCSLTVVPMKGWKREMKFEQTGLPWVPTSPHLPHSNLAENYVTTGILGELGIISEGVGYTLPFELFGAEWIDGATLAKKLNDLGLQGVIFRPLTFKPYYGDHSKENLHGVQIHIIDSKKLNLMSLQYLFLQVHHEMYPDKNIFEMSKSRWDMFDKVNGTSKIREMFSKNYKYSDIQDYLEKDIKSFKKLSQKYYLYK